MGIWIASLSFLFFILPLKNVILFFKNFITIFLIFFLILFLFLYVLKIRKSEVKRPDQSNLIGLFRMRHMAPSDDRSIGTSQTGLADLCADPGSGYESRRGSSAAQNCVVLLRLYIAF